MKYENKQTVENCLNDFIGIYDSKIKDHTLESIIVYSDTSNVKKNIVVYDAPKVYVLANLNKQKATSNYSIGKYKNVLCMVYNRKNTNLKLEVDSVLVEEAKKIKDAKDNRGNSITIDVSGVQWEPLLTITYDFITKHKSVQNSNEENVEVTKF